MSEPKGDAAAAPAAPPAPAAEPAPQGIRITEQQGREALAAAAEVLNGAAPSRILELAERIALAKVILRDVAAGALVIASPRSRGLPR